MKIPEFPSKGTARPASGSGIVARLRRLHSARQGFALIVTLTLMVLLTVVAMGLLTLSSISLRGAGQTDAMQIARSNARVALMMALGDLQKQVGPDQRITALADQRPSGSDGSQTSAQAKRSHWTGVYRAWPSTADTRPTPEFYSWLVSGDSASISKAATADTAPGTDDIELVGAGTVGSSTGSIVSVPTVKIAKSGSSVSRMAWWVGDQGVKSALSTPPVPVDASFAARRQTLQGAPRNATELASTSAGKPFSSLASDDARLAQVSDWQQAALLANDVRAPQELFHDLAPYSSGLLTNVRAGGFRKDLSMQLERPSASAPSTALYTVGGEAGINLQELWVYYNLYKELRKSGGPSYITGGRVPSAGPYLQVDASPTECQNDDEFFLKQPVIISYQLVLSFKTLPVTVGTTTVNRLHVVADPILTFWNPLDIPVVVPAGMPFTVKYWQVPYDLTIKKSGVAFDTSLPLIFGSATDSNFISLQVGGPLQQMVFKPGEVIKMSQTGSTIAKSAVPDNHKLGGKSGFNYGSGVAMPVKNAAGAFLDLGPAETFTYTAKANNITAGATGSDGNVPAGWSKHTRHFSLTHHEYYVGDDRGDASNSLGIGGMFIDWDFGNRRLQPGEDRGATSPGVAGTKASSARLTADRFPAIFKPIQESDGRVLSAGEVISTKAPFMMISYNAKTENGSDLGTRSLARFNPKALHVDFYDLTQAERDMLPYEFSIEPLTSWKNRSLEVSSTGNAYFGGGLNAEFGANFVSTHSVSREPIVSLAAFQHSFANGFNVQKPKYGYGTLNAREPMMPQISHAIGNSMASPVIPSEKTESTLAGGRPLADHSYLANRALWDDWFLSGITPQNSGTFAKSRTQKVVASDFLTGKAKLPTARFMPDLHGLDATKVANTYFASSTVPSDAATREIAALLRVDGLFNVNSTSVEAWKCLLGSLKGRPIIVRDATGAESIAATDGNTPVANLGAPQTGIARGTGTVAPKDPDQWVGRRTLTDAEIDSFARALVREVRKRGPFLSLADFVNRRVGTNKDLARAGAIQSALDSTDAKINDAYNGSRAVPSATTSRFTFPDAEKGPMSFGSPGIVKQADILTPIAPVLSVRSDSFVVRAYGESVDGTGRITARAWCEATVQRGCEFVDGTDAAEKVITGINSVNKFFGRRFKLVSFRWLNPTEV